MDGYWYVVQIYTGHEKKVKLTLDNMIAREELQDEILQINVPETEVVEVKDSQRKVSVRPSYPGYVLVNTTHALGPHVESEIGQKSWALIQETPGVMNFLGPPSHPSPLSPADVEAMLQMSTEEEEVVPVPAMEYEIGDKVKVINGPFSGFPGEIEEIDMEHQRLRLSISLFGRSTSVDLGLLEVEELN
ncbi:transcription termination/antitermination factor NusG [Candidatus Poribacteria bacterium]|nr:transcription termination/antitermination protein NusG [Candidatus Poribacteria bacterium]MXV74279.1 transcription termination/antitermination factor NusG [Candidatus Poribacteria bacterium]MYB00612.1 transcription termination/antitermination factor NusG [Candidatus Poribacteria bacterium]